MRRAPLRSTSGQGSTLGCCVSSTRSTTPAESRGAPRDSPAAGRSRSALGESPASRSSRPASRACSGAESPGSPMGSPRSRRASGRSSRASSTPSRRSAADDPLPTGSVSRPSRGASSRAASGCVSVQLRRSSWSCRVAAGARSPSTGVASRCWRWTKSSASPGPLACSSAPRVPRENTRTTIERNTRVRTTSFSKLPIERSGGQRSGVMPSEKGTCVQFPGLRRDPERGHAGSLVSAGDRVKAFPHSPGPRTPRCWGRVFSPLWISGLTEANRPDLGGRSNRPRPCGEPGPARPVQFPGGQAAPRP